MDGWVMDGLMGWEESLCDDICKNMLIFEKKVLFLLS